jgi:hypothetical protein
LDALIKSENSFDIWELAQRFDRKGVKVVGEMPNNLRLKDVVGITHYKNGMTKLSFNRNKILNLCVLNTRDFSVQVTGLIQEIKEREDFHDRWEPWEVFESEEPMEKQRRLIKSRLKTDIERQEFKIFYE